MSVDIEKSLEVQNSLKHVIFVDDNESEYDLSRRMFRVFMPNVELLWFPAGDQFMGFLKNNFSEIAGSTVVLMDVNMPAKGAREILEEMQENFFVGKIPVIIMSAFHKASDKEFYLQFPNVSFLTKPCGVAEYDQFIASLGKYIK